METACGGCGQPNRAGARFCDACGAALARCCTACGVELRPEARFCDSCGVAQAGDAARARRADPAPRAPASYTPRHLAERILQARAAIEGERKQVTVLFADVKGSMELAEQLDPEEWHAVLDRFFEILADGVHRFEGTVNQFTGDGIMALFGAPLAHEDHAQRAAYAALELADALRDYGRDVRRRHGVGFAFRMGLNSGEVVVGRIGDDLRMDYTAQGHCVGLAQRMEALAEADSCFVSDATAALVDGYVRLEDLGLFRVKGVAEPVRVRRLVGLGPVRTRFDLSRARGLVRFVGRDAEMRSLEAALDKARAGNGQVVGVVAEAGTGKSRLCHEFLESCRARGLRTVAGHAVAHGKNIPFLPILEVIRDYFGIGPEDEGRAAREKIAGRMLLLDESYRASLPLVFDFLGVPDPQLPAPPLSPEALQRRLFGLLHRLIQGGPQPGQDVSITMVEDLHWLDSGSEAWIGEWVDASVGAKSLLLLNFRPEYHASWMQRVHYQPIALVPLSAASTADLVGELIGADPSTAGLAARIHAHTAGNPFFVEEVVRSLIESGELEGSRGLYRLAVTVEKLAVPATVQAVLAARIDRLAECDKRVLQAAAAIGRTFDRPILAEVSEMPEGDLQAALAALRGAEFVYERALYPVAEYAFQHPLTQAVAYGTLLRERRRTLHGAAARAIEARTVKRDEDAALLAHHWQQAGEAMAASRWHLRAGDVTRARDVGAAERHASTVLELLRPSENEPAVAALLAQAAARLMNLGWRIGLAPEAAALYADGQRWARAANDPTVGAALAGGYAAVICLAGRIVEAYDVISIQFLDAVRGAGDSEFAAVAEAWGAYPVRCLGRLREAGERLVRGIARGERDPDFGTRFFGAGITGILYNFLIEVYRPTRTLAETSAVFERARTWFEQHPDPEAESYLYANFAMMVARYAGEVERGRALLNRARTIADDIGNPLAICITERSLAEVLSMQGQFAAAREFAQRALGEARRLHIWLNEEPVLLAVLAEAELGTGDVVSALGHTREALATAERIAARVDVPDVLRIHVRALLADGAVDHAAASLDRLEAEATAMGADNHRPLVAWMRADLAGARGDTAARRRWLAAARDAFVERGATGHADRVREQITALT